MLTKKRVNYEMENALKEVSRKERTQLNVWIEANSHRNLKAACSLDNATMTDVIQDAVNTYLKQRGIAK